MKRQAHLFKIDDDQLKALCERLPIRKTDRRIAYALAVLCSRAGAYAPEHGVGQSEIASLAGVGVRTVQRHIKYLTRYGILSITRATGRANVYQFDLVMLFDAPAPTHDIYKRLKADPEPVTGGESPRMVPDPLPLFDREAPAAPAMELPLFTRMARAAGGFLNRFTKRMNTAEAPEAEVETAATSEETPAKTPAKFPPFHSPFHSNPPEIKISTSNFQIHGGGNLKNDSDFKQEPPPPAPPADPAAPGVRRIIWPRSIRIDDLKNPVEIQELYLVAVEQGFFLDMDIARLNFFALAHYCTRAARVENKIGLFSSNVDRTIKDRFNKPFEEKISQADEDWARMAIKNIDFPPLVTTKERMNQA